MADLTSTAPKGTEARNPLTAAFSAIGNWLIKLAETGPRMAQLRRLDAMTDEQLAARGTTRADEVRRILAGLF